MASRGQLSVLPLLLVAIVGSTTQAAPRNASETFVIQPRVTWDSSCKCGQKPSGRIVGGQMTDRNEWPWQAALMYGNQQFCGGSLINDRYILTAAHCIVDLSTNGLTVRLAEHDLSANGETSLVTRTVSQIIEHPNYDAGTERNDIALLKLSSPVTMSATVLPVCMPPPKPLYTGQNAWVTGWGTTSSGGSSSSTLREVQIKVLSNSACRSRYSSSAITNSMVCASAQGKDSCQGDSGGPLVIKDGGGNYDQIGVVSWGYGCANSQYPGVYTRVNKYLDWIRDNTEDGVYCTGMKL